MAQPARARHLYVDSYFAAAPAGGCRDHLTKIESLSSEAPSGFSLKPSPLIRLKLAPTGGGV